MKTKAIIVFFLLCIIFTGCRKPTECKTSHWPEPGVTISWDGCNDVKTLKAYFDCHDSAIIINKYRNIEVCGYIKKDRLTHVLAICSDALMTPENNIPIYFPDGAPWPSYDTTCMSKVTAYISAPIDWNEGCCNCKLLLDIIKIEKL